MKLKPASLIFFLFSLLLISHITIARENSFLEEKRKKDLAAKKEQKLILGDEAFYSLLISEAQKYIEQTPVDSYIFSYSAPRFTTQAPYYEPGDLSQSERLFIAVKRFFWENDKVRIANEYPTWFGDGLYFATDPLISRGFGGSGINWQAYAYKLPKGTRYLNIQDQIQFKNPEIKATLEKNYSCKAKRVFELFQANITKTDASECRKVAKEMLRKINVIGVAYRYHSHDIIKNKYCPNTRQLAFYLTTEERPAQENITALTASLPPSGYDSASELRSAIQSLAKEKNLGGLFWPNLNEQSSSINLEAWTKENLLDCEKN